MNIKYPGRWLVLLALLAGLSAALYWRLSSSEETKARSSPSEQTVTVIQAKLADTPVVVEVNGSVVPLKAVEVRSQVSNLVREVLIKEGQVVKQGQAMFQLDDRNDIANIDKLRATLARNRALALDQDRQLARATELRAQNFISQGALDTTTAQRDAQWALVKSDQAALTAAEVALGYNTIRAPISGRTGVINIFPGTLVQAANSTLVTITQVDPIAVQFSLPESQYARLKATHAAASQGKVLAKVLATVPATGQTLEGDLYFVDNSIDPASGTIRVKASFSNPKDALWPGQFVQIKAELGLLKDALQIPAEAVVTTANGRLVYVVGDDNTVKPKPIQDVYAYKKLLVVTGISADDRIVLEGRQNLRPGGKVRINTATGDKK